MEGWIKLHRSVLEWEWYDDANTLRLFLHCLLKANHSDKTWRGITVKRGEFITSYDTLSKELRLTVKQIRTSLNKLKRTNELANKSTTQYTVIQVVKYDVYQVEDKQEGEPMANEGQTKGKQRATTKNDKNKKNDNNIIDYKSFVEFFNSTTNKNIRVTDTLKKLLKARLNDGYKKEDLLHVVQVKSSHWKGDEKMNQYLHPNTLFAKANFEKYIDEKKIEKSQNNDIILKQSDLNKNVW